MIENLSIKEIKRKIKEDVFYIIDNDCEDNKIEEFLIFYTKIIKNNNYENYTKMQFSQITASTVNNYYKEWFINFISTTIIKIFKNKNLVDNNLLINNDYFLFRLLANKEKIKSFNKKILIVFNFNSIIMSELFIYYKKNINLSTYTKDLSLYINNYNSYNISFFNKDDNINDYNYLLKNRDEILTEKEFETIQNINNQYFFIKNDKNEIIINEIFKNFMYLLFSLKIENNKFILNSDNKEILEKELSENIKPIW